MKKIYIITGANGFLGNNIVRKLEQENDVEVRALVFPNDKLDSLKGLNCNIYYGDVTKIDTLSDIFNVPKDCITYVIHCAGIVYIKSKFNPNVYNVNVNGTKNIVTKTMEINAKLVYVNSVHSIYENNKTEIIKEIYDFDENKVVGLYAKSKAIAAKYVLEMVNNNELNACIVQPSGIIGPNDFGNSHLTQLLIDYSTGKLKACVHGGYNFVDVRDVSDGIISVCQNGVKGNCYILSNKYYEIKDLLDIASNVGHYKKLKVILPMWIAKITAPLSELYYNIKKQAPLYTKYSLITLTSNSNFSNDKAKKELNYKPRNMEQTISDTLKWLRDNKRIK